MPAGTLRRPEDEGPFPAILWSHGSERRPAPQDELGDFYTSAGYVFFAPHRRGHGDAPGEHLEDELGSELLLPRPGAIEALLRAHERRLEDTLAALRWLREQPFVDPERIALSGVSHGGIQTLLAAEAGAGARAYVAFAPGATGWDGNPELQARLLRAVERAEPPVFLIQAANDHSLGPSEILGSALHAKGGLNRARVYPPFGTDGHGAFASSGAEVWGADVLEFVAEAFLPRSASSGRASSAPSR